MHSLPRYHRLDYCQLYRDGQAWCPHEPSRIPAYTMYGSVAPEDLEGKSDSESGKSKACTLQPASVQLCAIKLIFLVNYSKLLN
jgi:hypothetical protein